MRFLLRVLYRLSLAAIFCAALAGGFLYFRWNSVVTYLKPFVENQLTVATNARTTISDLRLRFRPFPSIEASGVEFDEGKNSVKVEHLFMRPSLSKIVRSFDLNYISISAIEIKGGIFNGVPFNAAVKRVVVRNQSEVAVKALTLRSGTLTLRGDAELIEGTGLKSAEFTLDGTDFDSMRAILTAVGVASQLPERGEVALKGECSTPPGGEVRCDTAFKLSHTLLKMGRGSLPIDEISGGVLFTRSALELKQFALATQGVRFVAGATVTDFSDLKKISFKLFDADVRSLRSILNAAGAKVFLPERGKIGVDGECQFDDLVTFKCGGKFSLGGIFVKNGTDAYSADVASGRINFSHDRNGGTVTGDTIVVGFGFDDGTTVLRKVNADLGDVRLTLPHKGDIQLRCKLTGKALNLAAGDFRISAVEAVNSPLSVVIPAKGGYSVSGPVDVKNGVMNFSGREFKETSGTVQMKISGKGQSYSSKNISARIKGVPLKLAVDFALEKSAFKIKDTVLGVGEGTVAVRGELGRGTPVRPFNATLDIKDLGSEGLNALANSAIFGESVYSVRTTTAAFSGTLPDYAKTLTGSGSSEVAFRNDDSGRKTVFKKIIDATASLPGVSLMRGSTPPDEKRFSRVVKGNYRAANGVLDFSKVKLSQESTFDATAAGTLDLEGNLNIRADVIFLQDTFNSLGMGYERLGKALAKAGRIAIPVKITGKLGDPSVSPDLASLMQNNIGVRAIGSAVGVVTDTGKAVGDFVSSPFRKESK